MVAMRNQGVVRVLWALSCLASAVPLHADTRGKEVNAFFDEDTVNTVFAPGLTPAERAEIKFYDERPWEQPTPESTPSPKGMLVPATAAAKSAIEADLEKRAPHRDKALEEKPLRERLVLTYGDPTQNTPVLAQDNAPVPFKGLMAALQEGDEELGFQYAKQYVRYVRDLQDRVSRITSLTGLAMRREGLITPENSAGWQNAPQYLEDRQLYEGDVVKSLKDELKKNGIDLEGMPQASALIDKAIEQTSVSTIASLAPRQVDVTRIPRDLEGRAVVQFVVKIHGELGDQAGRAIAAAEQALKQKNNLQIQVFIADEEQSDLMAAWAKEHNITAPVEVVPANIQLNLSLAPITVVKGAGTSNEARYVERGIRHPETLARMVDLVQGKKVIEGATVKGAAGAAAAAGGVRG